MIKIQYGLQNIENDDFNDYMKNHWNTEEVTITLCHQGTVWKVSKDEEISFLTKKLDRIKKMKKRSNWQ